MAQNKDMVVAGLAGILSGILAYKAITGIPAIITTLKTAIAGIELHRSHYFAYRLVVTAVMLWSGHLFYFYTTN